MADQIEIIRFHNTAAFTGLTGVVNEQDAVIHGVSLITADVDAEGHNLHIDDETVGQLFTLAKGMGQVPVTLDHDGGINDVNGYIDGFRMDGKHLRGDWHLLKSHDETVKMLERAQRQPKTFGLSVAFKGDPKGVLKLGKRRARAEKLLSADCVTRPAANPAGMFSAKDGSVITLGDIKTMLIKLSRGEEIEEGVDSLKKDMPEPTLADIMTAVKSIQDSHAALATRIDQFSGVQDQLVQAHNASIEGQGENEGIDRDTLEALAQMSPEELAAFNKANNLDITDADITSAVDQFNAQFASDGEGDEGGEGEGEGEGQGGGELAGAGVGGGEGSAATGNAVTMKALAKEVINLRARLDSKEKAERKQVRQVQLSAIENDVALIARQRDEAIELAASITAHNEALEMYLRTGTRPPRTGVGGGELNFRGKGGEELHQFDVRVSEIVKTGKTEAQAIMLASRENQALHMDWVQSNGVIRA